MATDRIILPGDPVPAGRSEATRSKTEDGVTKHWTRVIPEKNRTKTFRGIGSTFRIPGSAALAQPLWSIENTTGSAVLVALKQLQVVSAQTVANLTSPPWYYLFRTTVMPTGGTAFTKTSIDSREASTASAANVIVRGGASADGTISAITAPAAGQRFWSGYGKQLYTAAGIYQSDPTDMMPDLWEDEDLVLGPGAALVLHVTAAAAADNIATRWHMVSCAWEEYTEF